MLRVSLILRHEDISKGLDKVFAVPGNSLSYSHHLLAENVPNPLLR